MYLYWKIIKIKSHLNKQEIIERILTPTIIRLWIQTFDSSMTDLTFPHSKMVYILAKYYVKNSHLHDDRIGHCLQICNKRSLQCFLINSSNKLSMSKSKMAAWWSYLFSDPPENVLCTTRDPRRILTPTITRPLILNLFSSKTDWTFLSVNWPIFFLNTCQKFTFTW